MATSNYPDQPERVGYVALTPSAVRDRLALRADEYLLVRDCPRCGKESEVIVPAQGLWDWEHGKLAQDAFPVMPPYHRETIITGLHPACWQKDFDDVFDCPARGLEDEFAGSCDQCGKSNYDCRCFS